MAVVQSGRLILVGTRTVTSSDTATPTGDSPAGAVTVSPDAKGERCHFYVSFTGSADSPSAIFTIFAMPYTSNAQPNMATNPQGTWFAVGQLNSGAAINNTTDTPIKPASNGCNYAEAFTHLSVYSKLYVMVTSLTNATDVSVTVGFETN